MGIYTWINDMLKQAFGTGNEVDDFMEAIWFSELYSMFFKNQGGFYNTALSISVEKLQFILFEANHNAGTFITSDNPAFQHISLVETTNMNGYCFPISPQYFLFIAKGRVVIEIDGKQHYADGDRASPRLYSEMVKAQREMSLYGYDVYRFGGYEFINAAESDSIKQELLKNLKEFFIRLFQKYNILER